MELDTFILTVEDFLGGSIEESFLKEETTYTKEEMLEYKKNTDNKNLLIYVNIILSALDEMLNYTGKDKGFIKLSLEKIKTASFQIEQEKRKRNDIYVTKAPSNETYPHKFEYSIPEGMRNRLPVKNQTYYKEPSIKLIKYNHDPENSPFYDLISSYERLKENKIDNKIWIQKLVDGEENLNDLLDKLEEYTGENPEKAEELNKFIFEGLRLLEYIQLATKGKKSIDGFMVKIRKVNLNIYELKEELFPDKVNQKIITSISEAYKIYKNEHYETANYMQLKNTAEKFIKWNIEKKQLLNIIEKMRSIIENAKKQYDEISITKKEMTPEILRNDRLFKEGVMFWSFGLELQEYALNNDDKKELYESFNYVFTGNKKLILLQHFSEEIRKRVVFRV
jgi:hypothetical protein